MLITVIVDRQNLRYKAARASNVSGCEAAKQSYKTNLVRHGD